MKIQLEFPGIQHNLIINAVLLKIVVDDEKEGDSDANKSCNRRLGSFRADVCRCGVHSPYISLLEKMLCVVSGLMLFRFSR